MMKFNNIYTIITAGSTYLDIDAYACCLAMQELLELQGIPAIAYSTAPCNYSICASLVEEGQMLQTLPEGFDLKTAQYIIVDVSDPEYIRDAVPLDKVVEVYDHHVGFEEYWEERIGEKSHIEFIGAAATLIYREWKKAGLHEQMSSTVAKLLLAAMLDNTLYLTSSNTTDEDIEVFHALCEKEHIGEEWCVRYFSEVQENVEKDLKNALFGDLKTIRDNAYLPPRMAQICVWDTQKLLGRLEEVKAWFAEGKDSWIINVIDLKKRCSYFVCEDKQYQKKIESVFAVSFDRDVAKTKIPYLRKEIIKKTVFSI